MLPCTPAGGRASRSCCKGWHAANMRCTARLIAPRLLRPCMDGRARPSPLSTGGGGCEYERMVGATYPAATVCGGASPSVAGTVAEVESQQHAAGHILNNAAAMHDGNGGAHKLSLQAEHNQCMGRSPDFKDAVADCWCMFMGREGTVFDRSADRLGMVAPLASGRAHRNCLPVLETARAGGGGAAFWSRLKRGAHFGRRLESANFVRDAAAGSAEPVATGNGAWKFLWPPCAAALDADGQSAAGRTLAATGPMADVPQPSHSLCPRPCTAAACRPCAGAHSTAALAAAAQADSPRGHPSHVPFLRLPCVPKEATCDRYEAGRQNSWSETTVQGRKVEGIALASQRARDRPRVRRRGQRPRSPACGQACAPHSVRRTAAGRRGWIRPVVQLPHGHGARGSPPPLAYAHVRRRRQYARMPFVRGRVHARPARPRDQGRRPTIRDHGAGKA